MRCGEWMWPMVGRPLRLAGLGGDGMNPSNALWMACAGLVLGAATNAAMAQSAPAPTFKVGDRWVYNVKSGVGISPITYQETREVTAVSGGSTKLTITGKTANGVDFTRVDEYSGPAALKYGAPCADEAYRFPTPLQRV